MKITPNFETNHTELTFTRASHTTNIEKLAVLYTEHLRTLDFSLENSFNKGKAEKDKANMLLQVIDMMPFSSFNEIKKYLLMRIQLFSPKAVSTKCAVWQMNADSP